MTPWTRWSRRLNSAQAVIVIVGGAILLGLIAIAGAVLPPIAAGITALAAGGLYLTWCARLPYVP